MTRVRLRYLLIIAAALVAGLPSISAAWLYDPGERLRSGIPLYGPECPYKGDSTAYWGAQRFYLPWNARISSFGAGLAKGSDPNSAGFKVLLVDDIYNIQGSTIASWTVYPASAIVQWYYWEAGDISLQANRDYALVFIPGDSVMYGCVAWASAGVYQAQFSPDNGTSWVTSLPYAMAIRVDGTIIPESSSFLALSPMLGGLLLRLRFIRLDAHRKQVRSNKTGV